MQFAHREGSRPLPTYVIRRGLGVGGFGEVYLAESNAGKKVALKLVQRNLEIELRGAKNCLNIKHPNLLSLYDICEDESGNAWLSMEYVEGSNLRQVLQNHKSGMHLGEVHRWITGLIDGVKHLHDSGIIHRDLKPENIFDERGNIKVGDYGLSTVIRPSGTRQTEGVGTVHYMAPEVGRGEYGPSVDIYAMGIILYELLTGDVPFDGETKNEIMLKHLTADPNLDSLPAALRMIVSRCLLKDPDGRYQDLNQLKADLNLAFTDQESSEILDAELVERTPSENCVTTNSLDAVTFAGPESQLSLTRSPTGNHSSHSNLKFLVVVFLMIGMLIHPFVFIPLACLLFMAYAPVVVLQRLRGPLGFNSGANEEAQPKNRIYHAGSKRWRLEVRASLANRTVLQRSRDWLLSAAFAVPFAGAVSLIVTAVLNGDQSFRLGDHASMVWSAAMAGLASIGLIAVAQKWEVEEEYDFSRRFVLAGFGAVLGTIAFFLHQYLLLGTELSEIRDVAATDIPTWIYSKQSPTLFAYCSHFSLLFFFVRWCRLADPLRGRRVSVWLILVPVIAEWCVQQVFPIVQPAGMVFSGCLTVVLQIASPRITALQREHLLALNQSHAIGAVH